MMYCVIKSFSLCVHMCVCILGCVTVQCKGILGFYCHLIIDICAHLLFLLVLILLIHS